ncbi:MAG: thymidylate kinase [Clostridia bacterium]|nr:thymidylate kinase [Clostridia bacterium]
MGKLIVLEGLDGSGKSTQLELLPKRLQQNGIDCQTVSFPNYESDSSALIKMYLSGKLGDKPTDVNAYAASVFYTVDRFVSYQLDWGNYYRNGGTVVAGRYTTSNAIHQTSKLPREEWAGFLDWLYDFEYRKIGIPKPDIVLFLDMPIDVSQRLMSGRYQGDEAKKDIHEKDTAYLDNCRKAALFTAQYSGWQIIPCADGGRPRPIEAISDDLLAAILKLFEG